MINIYTVTDTDYSKNGSAVLHPLVCTVTEALWGSYELHMEHPIDDKGIWRLIQTGHIVRVPVPAAHVDNTFIGEDAIIWKADRAANVYVSPKAPQPIYYAAWSGSSDYSVGTKVTVHYVNAYGANAFENYQCTKTFIAADVPGLHNPRFLPEYWKQIPSTTAGAAKAASLAADEEFFLLSQYDESWLFIQTAAGVQGYVQTAYCSFVREEHREEKNAHEIRTQLFRIYSISVDTKARKVTAEARHVSYDHAGNLARRCEINNATIPDAIKQLDDALYAEPAGTITTNYGADDGTFTGSFTWRNPVSCMLDPDTGMAPLLGAKFIRDNWDMFVLKDENIDRGVRLEYGKNLIGVTWKTNTDKLVNRIIPVAQKADGSELLLPEIWVDSPIIETYPVIIAEQLKVDAKVGEDDGQGGTWTEETIFSHMRAMANRRFTVDNSDKAAVQLNVDFRLLGDTVEYSQFRKLQKLFIYDTVRTRDPNVDLDLSLRLNKYKWDCVWETYINITLGNTYEATSHIIAGYNMMNGSIQYNKLSQDAINKIKAEVTA